MTDKKSFPVYDTSCVHAETKWRDPGYVMATSHCHSCYELFYAETGSCRFLIDDSIFDLRAGDFIFVPPMSLHYTRYMYGQCKRTVILFRYEEVPAEIRQTMPSGEKFFHATQLFQVPSAHRERVGACLEQMVYEERINDSRSELMRKIQLWGLLLLCGRVCIFLSDPPSDIHTTDQQIIKAAHYINAHYMNPMTTADVAQAVGFSPNYLSRKFRSAAGIGLHEYLVFVRLNHAALELVSTRDSITTIALRCGFSDSNYFKDSFKKKYGITPREYRRIG